MADDARARLEFAGWIESDSDSDTLRGDDSDDDCIPVEVVQRGSQGNANVLQIAPGTVAVRQRRIPKNAVYHPESHELLLGWTEIEQCSYYSPRGPRTISYRHDNFTVEFRAPERNHSDFLRIRKIFQHLDGSVMLGGLLCRRSANVQGYEDLFNELVMILHYDHDDQRPLFEKGLTFVPLSRVLKRRCLIITNKPFQRSRNLRNFSEGEFANGRLCVRSVIEEIRHKPNAAHNYRQRGHLHRSVKQDESDKGYEVSDLQLFLRSQGHIPASDDKIAYAEAFCGACFCACAAEDLAFEPRWVIDINAAAISLARINLRATHAIHHMDISEFLCSNLIEAGGAVNICHASCPCQCWSQATTHDVPSHEQLRDLITSVQRILHRFKPRVMTLEQVPGIAEQRKHRHWFHALLRMFTDERYNIRFRIIDLKKYGVPQTRNRLVIIASCPGTTIPSLPTQTHGHGLLPYRTIADVLSEVENTPGLTHHQPAQMPAINKAPYNANRPSSCMTTQGALEGNYHPSGRRGFTIREWAALQDIPLTFQFPTHLRPREILRCIGNSVPHGFMVKLFHSIEQHIRAENEVLRACEASVLDATINLD